MNLQFSGVMGVLTAQPLHPGGRNYPDEHRAPRPGHEKHKFGITAADISKFDDVEESAFLHTRFGQF